MTDTEIREALKSREIEIEPLSEESLQPASYDLRLGDRAILSKRIEIETLRHRIEREEAVPEIDLAKELSIAVPAGGFALVVTKERLHLSPQHAGHIGLRSYFARKGLLLLSGLQVDPGFEGHLVLGLANLSPRSVRLDYEDPIATLEIHRLSQPASAPYSGTYAGQQLKPRIPRADADYLRTIETMSVSDLTQALMNLSDNVATLTKNVQLFWLPVVITILGAVLFVVLDRTL